MAAIMIQIWSDGESEKSFSECHMGLKLKDDQKANLLKPSLDREGQQHRREPRLTQPCHHQCRTNTGAFGGGGGTQVDSTAYFTI